MAELRKLFQKAGGFKLLKQYSRAGVLAFAITQVVLLGFSKKALEILRLSVQLKIQKKLSRKYQYVLDRCDKIDYGSLPKKQSNKVWVCWLQGIENAPLVVQKCYKSLQQHLTDREIVLLTSENIGEYATFPHYIIEKWEAGIISNTHFSDLLRIEVLVNHGGAWIDSTVLCTGSNIPDYIFDSDLFFYQILKPGRDGHSIHISSWLMSATTNNKILLITRELLYEYWLKKKSLIDYFLLHIFICITCDKYLDEQKNITKFSNSIPHILQLDLFEQFDEKKYENVKQMTCFHKLSYKFDVELLEKKGTYYDMIINKEAF